MRLPPLLMLISIVTHVDAKYGRFPFLSSQEIGLTRSRCVARVSVAFYGTILVHMPVLSTCPLHTNSECGKERRILIGPW